MSGHKPQTCWNVERSVKISIVRMLVHENSRRNPSPKFAGVERKRRSFLATEAEVAGRREELALSSQIDINNRHSLCNGLAL